MTKLFVLDQAGVGSLFETGYEEVSPKVGEAPRCPKCNNFVARLPWLPPYRAAIELHGAKWGDFAFAGSRHPLASSRVVEACRDAHLQEVAFEPVEVVSARGSVDPPLLYHRVAFARWGAVLDEQQSTLLRSQPLFCDFCMQPAPAAVRGFQIASGTWTGADIFTVRGLGGTIVVSERFAELAKQHDFTNISLVPIERYEIGIWDRWPLNQAPGGGGEAGERV
jgi:hypothetical protein